MYKFCGNRGEGIYKFCGNNGNMHHWLRGMDAPALTSYHEFDPFFFTFSHRKLIL